MTAYDILLTILKVKNTIKFIIIDTVLDMLQHNQLEQHIVVLAY